MGRFVLGIFILTILAENIFAVPLTKSDEVTPTTTNGDVTEYVTDSQDTDEDFATKYLKKYGYSNTGIMKNSYNSKNHFKDSIKRFQKFHQLNITGELDNDTMEVIKSPRCSLPDIITGSDRRKKRFVPYWSWPFRSLTYRTLNGPARSNGYSSQDDIKNDIKKAFGMWSENGNIQFTESQTPRSNLELAFYSRDHGDGDPFDGPGGTLAHAFFPNDGRVHFDNDENWSKTNFGFNFLQVATHEIGHAIGLGHSQVRSSIMYPTYSYKSNFGLDSDDIKGVQYFYGPAIKVPDVNITSTTTTSNGRPTTTTTANGRTTTTTTTTTTARPPAPPTRRPNRRPGRFWNIYTR